MLVAKRKDGSIFSLADDYSYDKLNLIRKESTFYCPGCHQEVILKIGKSRISHFAHTNENACNVQAEHESSYHLAGKLKLFYWLEKQFPTVLLEPYLPSIAQRPDLLFVNNKRYFAIEYQCSTISYEKMNMRTKRMREIGITPLWVLGGNRTNVISQHVHKLSSFDWHCTSQVLHYPYIMYFCPHSSQFLLLTSLFPFSATTVITKASYLPMKQTSLTQLLANVRSISSFPFLEEWLDKKKNWRIHANRYLSNYPKVLQALFYTSSTAPSLLPSEAGIPLPLNMYISTNAIIWQSWILIQWMIRLPVGQKVPIKTILSDFEAMVWKGVFRLRSFPLIQQGNYKLAILEYIQWLGKIGILRKEGDFTFYKKRNIELPHSLEKALITDRELLSKNNDSFMKP